MTRKTLFLVVVTAIAVVAVGLAHVHGVVPPHAGPLDLVPLVPLLPIMGSVNDTVVNDKGAQMGPIGTLMQQIDLLVRENAYWRLHRPAWQVAAAAVAPPVLATATVTTQVKSTATTQLMVNGVLTSLTATDPLLLAADIAAGDPNVLAVGSVRRWQVCWDGAAATTKITCRPSNDQVIANFANAAAALLACRWPSLPPAGTVIVGLVDITNVTNVFTPGTTLLGAAGVTAAYHDGPDANCGVASIIAP